MSDESTLPPAAQDATSLSVAVLPRPPGSGLLGAVGWTVLLLVVQIPFYVLARGMTSFLKDASELAVVALSGCVAATLLVVWQYRGAVRRTLGLRGVAWLHTTCVVLLVLPLALFNIALAGWIRSAYTLAGATWSLEGPRLYYAFAKAA